MRHGVLAALAGTVLLVAHGSAHHYFSAEFDGSTSIEVSGIVTKIEWTNPHVYFYVDVTEGDAVANWGFETAGPAALIRQGWRRDALKVGDKVVVSGYPARDGSKLMDARRVTFADGHLLFGESLTMVTPRASGSSVRR